MYFLKPEYLIMMALPTVVLFYFIVMHKSSLEVYFDAKILKKLRYDNNALGKIGRNGLFFIALLLMIVALARPVKDKVDMTQKIKSIDMVVALDISASMMATDYYPSRIAFAKKRFLEFVDRFDEANIGVIAFASEGFLVSPMTQDSTTLKYLVHHLSLDSISQKGTNLLIPIEKANAFLSKSKEKIVVLFTDGGDSSELIEEIKKAKSYGERVYVYGVATVKGAPIKIGKESLKDSKGHIVLSRLNETIKELAFETGGAYIVGTYEDDSIAQLVKEIKAKATMSEKKEKKIKVYKELFYYPLAAAVIFLLFAFHSFPRKESTIMIVLFLLSLSPASMQAKLFDFRDISKAEEAYAQGQYDKASEHFFEVVTSNKSAESFYDYANALYKEKKYKKALKAYENVIALNPRLKYKKAFNIGNTQMQLKQYKRAIASYEKAQKIQDDADVKHNLALARKMQKKREQKKKKQKKGKKKAPENKQKKGKKKEQPKDQKSQKQTSKEQGSPTKPKQGSREKQESKKRDDMTQKEEKLWQQRLERMTPKTMPIKLDTKSIQRSHDEKPW